jgi:C4-dicarboxylate transporter, DctQ subunit
MTDMRSIWSRVDQQLERWLITVFYGYFCLIILVEVVRRYIFGSSSEWGEMTARYAFVYLVYIAAAEVAKSNDHIRIDIVPRLLGPRGRLALYLYFDLICLVLAALVIYYSLGVVQLSIATDTLMTGFDLNMAFAQAALPIGWSLLAYRVVQRFARSVKSYKQRGEVPLGGGGFGES